MIPTPRAVLDEEPSAPGPDDGAGARAAGPDDGAGGMVAGSMTAGGIWKEYTDWNSFTLDVHRYAAAQGKQVITDPLRRGSKSRHMRCTDYQEKLAGYELAVLAKYDGDVAEQAAHLQRTPFATVAHQYRACPFVVVASRSRKDKPIRVSALAPNGKSVLTHSEGCRSVVKVKPTTLMNDTNIKRVVLSTSGKATGRQLEAAAQAAGLVTTTVALYAAQRQLKRAEANGSSRIAAWLSKEPTRRQRTGDTNDIPALNYDAIISGGHGTGVGLSPPEKRAKSHGNSKYGRYKGGNKNDRAGRGSRGARTRGRTRVAASIASVTIGSERAHLLCKKCKAGGRVGPEYLGHRSGVCPFEQKIVLMSSSSSEDEDEDKKMAASHSGK